MELHSIDEYFEYAALKFAEKTGHKILSFLGKGENGNAYLTDDGKVIKVTIDYSEYIESKKLLNKETIHLPKIYDCYILESKKIKRELPYLNGMQLILLEKVDHDLIKQKILFDGLSECFEEKFNEEFFGVLSLYHTNQIDRLKMQTYLDILDLEDEWKDYFNQIIELIDELKKYNIKSIDYKPENFGFKGDRLIYFDIGFGDDYDDGNHKILKF